MAAVVLLSHGFQAEYEAGFTNGLARNGLDVTLVGSDTTLVERLAPGVRFVNLRGSQRPDRPRMRKAANMVRYLLSYWWLLLRRRGDRVHVIGVFSTGNAWLSLAEAWMTRWLAGGYVLTVHNLLPHDRHTPLNAALSRWIYRSASRLMVHTPRAAAGLCARFAIAPERVVVVEHGIDRCWYDDGSARAAMRRRLGIGDEERVALFFGTMLRYKGLDLLLEAFALSEARAADRLVVAGMCKDAGLSRALAEQRGRHVRAADILWREGYVLDEDIVPLLQAADVLVLPYRHIDQSGVLFMAIATGLPVVATDVGSFADYVGATGGQVVPAEDAAALAAGVGAILSRGSRPRTGEPDPRFLWSNTIRPLLSEYGAVEA